MVSLIFVVQPVVASHGNRLGTSSHQQVSTCGPAGFAAHPHLQAMAEPLKNSRTALSYIVHPRVWGQGIGTKIGRQLLAHGFGELGLHRIHATCDPRNLGSSRVLSKIGMTHEGRLCRTALLHDGRRDSMISAASKGNGAPLRNPASRVLSFLGFGQPLRERSFWLSSSRRHSPRELRGLDVTRGWWSRSQDRSRNVCQNPFS